MNEIDRKIISFLFRLNAGTNSESIYGYGSESEIDYWWTSDRTWCGFGIFFFDNLKSFLVGLETTSGEWGWWRALGFERRKKLVPFLSILPQFHSPAPWSDLSYRQIIWKSTKIKLKKKFFTFASDLVFIGKWTQNRRKKIVIFFSFPHLKTENWHKFVNLMTNKKKSIRK